MRVETLAHRKMRSATTKRLASEVGFCVVDDNADLIAGNLIAQIRELTSGIETRLNRLYKGREAYTLSDGEIRDLTKLAGQFLYFDRTASDILAAQASSEPVLQAAE
jgi:hypothetical protein